MADASNGPSQFFNDLSRIRASRDISLEALHEETKIPVNLLQEFEATGLADHPMFNRVYLRSLVRAYAEVIDIEEEAALDALEDYLTGSYAGSLAATYLGEGPPPERQAEPPTDSAEREADTVEEPAQTDKRVGKQPAPPVVPPPAKRETRAPVRREPPVRRGSEAESAANWDAVSPAPGSQRREPIDYGQQRSYMQWVLVAGAILGLVGVIWLVFSFVGGGEDARTTPPVAVEDTTTAPPDTTTPEPQRPRVALGDTMDVVIIAEGGAIAGIRITRDEDLRRPYWIEQGVAKAFPTMQRIVLEERLNLIRLLLEGYEYPTDRRDDQGRIVLTRESAQAFLDTLQGPPVNLSQAPDTIPVGPIQNQ